MCETFEKLLVVWYKFGLAMNDGLNASFNDLLARAEVQFKRDQREGSVVHVDILQGGKMAISANGIYQDRSP